MQAFSIVFGFLLISCTEPLALTSYLLRAFRLKKIFDAQQAYYSEGVRPTDAINKFRQARLVTISAGTAIVFTLIFLVTGLLLNFVPSSSLLYWLPSFDSSSFSHTNGISVTEVQL